MVIYFCSELCTPNHEPRFLLADLSGSPRLVVSVAEDPGTLQEVSRLCDELPPGVGSLVGARTEPASPGRAKGRILVLRFQVFEPQEILRVLEGAGIQVLSLTGVGGSL